VKITKNSIISGALFLLLIAVLMALEEFYEGEMSATTAVEEVLAYLSILVVLFFAIVLPFDKIIHRFNETLNWKDHFFLRILAEGMLVVGLSTALGWFFGQFIHHYIDHALPTAVVVFRTILFLFICASLIMALLELRYMQDEKKELRELSQRLEKENIETLYNSLKQQVNPHFLFNSLSVLSSLIHYDIKKADAFIEHFADIYRYVLEMNQHKLVSIQQEMTFLDSYLYLQRIRFGENIILKISIDKEATASQQIPPLSLQLIFENILKHNIISSEYPMSIEIKIEKDSLIIENSLKEKPGQNSSGIGIPNLKEKYKLLNASPPLFLNKGDRFQVRLPLIKKVEQ
jgi:two-component system LytT family sensor kinase